MSRLKTIVLGAAKKSGALALVRTFHHSQFRVMAYHGVETSSDGLVNFDGFQVPADIFREQMEILLAGYNILPLNELLQRSRSHEPLPQHAVAITFDDGYLNNLTVAAPILREYKMPATFFITTGFIDGTHEPWWYTLRQAVASATVPSGASQQDKIKTIVSWESELKDLQAEVRATQVRKLAASCKSDQPGDRVPMMSWSDVKELRDMGFDIGPHTATHISLGVESPHRVEEEVALSLQGLKEHLGIQPSVYSYPYGRAADVGGSLIKVMKKFGLEAGLTTIEGLNRPGASPWHLRRLNVTGHYRGPAFESLVAGLTTSLHSARHAV